MNANVPNPRILLVEDSIFYSKTLANFLAKLPCSLEITRDYSQAKELLTKKKFDLGIFNLTAGKEKDAGFEFISSFRAQNPGKEIIFLTDENIDDFIEKIAEYQVSCILAKPIRRDEFLSLINKLFHKGDRDKLFGLGNYLIDARPIEKIEIFKTRQIPEVIGRIFDYAEQVEFTLTNKYLAKLVINEMLVNALYHSHGYTKEKLNQETIELPHGQKVEISFSRDETRFGVSITDFMGTLSKKRILETIRDIVLENRLLASGEFPVAEIFDKVKTSGRGIEIVRRFSGEFIYIIEKGRRTEAILIFDSILEKDDIHTSIKVLEVE
jgi:DNA-binding NarL/FixJ family response regulator